MAIHLSFDKFLVGPWVFSKIGKVWSPEGREVVGLVDGDIVLGGVVYEDYTGSSVCCHIAIAHPHVPLRKLLVAAARYAYNQLGVKKVIGMVPSNNEDALRMDFRLGFELEAIVRDVFPDGSDMVILTMTREQCRFLPRQKEAA